MSEGEPDIHIKSPNETARDPTKKFAPLLKKKFILKKEAQDAESVRTSSIGSLQELNMRLSTKNRELDRSNFTSKASDGFDFIEIPL